MNRTIEDFHKETLDIGRQADAIVSEPIVTDGYRHDNRDPNLARYNIGGLAWKRLQRWFAFYNPKDEAQLRIYAMARLIAAECIRRKYEARRDRKTYDMAEDCDVKIEKMVKGNLQKMRDEVRRLFVQRL